MHHIQLRNHNCVHVRRMSKSICNQGSGPEQGFGTTERREMVVQLKARSKRRISRLALQEAMEKVNNCGIEFQRVRIEKLKTQTPIVGGSGRKHATNRNWLRRRSGQEGRESAGRNLGRHKAMDDLERVDEHTHSSSLSLH